MVDLPAFAAAFKDIVSFPGWGPPEETGYMTFSAPLAIAGLVEAGFALHGGSYHKYRDGNVSFELVLNKTPIRKRMVLARVEWRSLRGGHSNKRSRPFGIPRRTEATHFHSFDLNYLESERRMRGGNLPYADNVENSIENFEALLEFVGSRFNIRNINLVEPPDWEYGLF